MEYMTKFGVAVLESREGVRFKRYLDSKGVPTIGCGHTGRMSGSTNLPETCTQAQVDDWLHGDLLVMETLMATVESHLYKPLLPNERDALLSFGFNIGGDGFMHSSAIAKLLKGDKHGCAVAMSMWEKPAVLVSRREREIKQFLTPYAKAPAPRAIPRPDIPLIVRPVTPKVDAKPAATEVKPPMTKMMMTTGLASSMVRLLFTYGPEVASMAGHAVSNSADMKKKGADLWGRLKAFDVPGALVDVNAIVADLGVSQDQLHDVVHHAVTNAPPSVSGFTDFLEGAAKSFGVSL